MSQFKKQSNKNSLNSILNCIVQIFYETMDKLQLVITVPLLIKNSTLQSFLTKEEMELVNNIVYFTDQTESEHKPHLSESRISRSSYGSSTNALEEDITDKSIPNAMIFKMLKILCSYPGIRKAAASCETNVSKQSLLFKHHIYYFMEYITSIMQLTPEEEMVKNMHYRNVWLRDKNAVDEIRKLTAYIEAQREDKEKEIGRAVTQYKTETIIINKLNQICLEDLQSVGNKYEKKQYLLYNNWETKRNELLDKLDQIKREFEMIKTANFKTTLDINNKRLKTEAQLLSMINRFDTDMNDKLSEYEELWETYESDKMEKNSLKAAIQLQEDTYNLFFKNVFDETMEYYGG